MRNVRSVMYIGMFYGAGLSEMMDATDEIGRYFILQRVYFAKKMCKFDVAAQVLFVPTGKVKEIVAGVAAAILSQLTTKEEVDGYAIG